MRTRPSMPAARKVWAWHRPSGCSARAYCETARAGPGRRGGWRPGGWRWCASTPTPLVRWPAWSRRRCSRPAAPACSPSPPPPPSSAAAAPSRSVRDAGCVIHGRSCAAPFTSERRGTSSTMVAMELVEQEGTQIKVVHACHDKHSHWLHTWMRYDRGPDGHKPASGMSSDS